MMTLLDRDLLSIDDFSTAELLHILKTAAELKRNPEQAVDFARGKTLAMIFEKQSLRTRVSFEVAMTQMGGHAIYLQPSDIGLGKREPVKDVARNLERMCNAIMARTFAHQTVVDLAQNSRVPVINALSDSEHPCQALADFLTIGEHLGAYAGLTLAYVGDGNNVAHSLMLLSAKLGVNFRLACPEGYEPDKNLTRRAIEIGAGTGATITIGNDPAALVAGADAVYTDVWTSMGQEEEMAKRMSVFPPYQLNMMLMSRAKPGALVMHCLPAHRGEEITDEAFESPQSVVFDQAENRLHAQKAVLALFLGWSPVE